MSSVKSNLNKNIYKIFLSIIKYIPVTLSVIQIAGLILNYLGIKSELLTCIGGSSLIFIGILYLLSYLFRYCYLYRIPLHYITIIIVISAIDTVIGLPLTTITLYRVYTTITGLFCIAYMYYIYKNRNNPKIDHIKQLCENYCDCK